MEAGATRGNRRLVAIERSSVSSVVTAATMRSSLYAVLFSSFAAAAQCSFQQQCSKLASKLKVDNATVWFAEYVAAGTNMSFPDTDASCGQAPMAVGVDFCRVALHVATSDRSGISMEAWLPRNWTGRFLSTGNGGLN